MSWIDIIPLTARGRSLADQMNVLARNGSVFAMDNHRAALWCWLQTLPTGQRFNFLHIDAHWDCLEMITPEIWRDLEKPVTGMSIDEYLNYPHPTEDFALFRWDNYIPPFLEAHAPQVVRTFTACHGLGSKYKFDEEIEAHQILGAIENIFDHSDLPWVVNIDCDYFFATQRKRQLYTDEVISDVGQQIRELDSRGRLLTCTIALSPECCGGWEASERACEVLTTAMGMPLRLPQLRHGG